MGFLRYLFKYKFNTLKMQRQEEMIEVLTEEANFQELKRFKAENALLRINRILSDYERGGSFYSPIYRQIKKIVDESVEKKFADEILPNYTSTNSK